MAAPTRSGQFRYLVFGRVLPAAIFAIFGWRTILGAIGQTTGLPHNASFEHLLTGPISAWLYCGFVCVPVVIYIMRPPPQRRDGSAPARALAFTGTLMLLLFGAYVSQGPAVVNIPQGARDAAAVLLAVFYAIALIGLIYLRLSFSIVPEARRLVTGGPYRYIRHPLYLGEIGTAISLLFTRETLYLWAAVVIVPFIAVQYGRTVFEEALLRQAFPEYDDYAERTHRLIPFVW